MSKANMTDAKMLQLLAKESGLTVAEMRKRIAEGRKTREQQERERQSAEMRRSIRLSLGEMEDSLTDAHDLAWCAKLGRTGALDPTTVLHAIERITEACREEFREVCKALDMTPLHFDQEIDQTDKQ